LNPAQAHPPANRKTDGRTRQTSGQRIQRPEQGPERDAGCRDQRDHRNHDQSEDDERNHHERQRIPSVAM
jgi:hypothetical protein